MTLLGDDLDSSTLHLYLKDSTFAEYFNSFLLLPAFSCRLFFDQETGYFEPVHGEGTRLCWGDGGEVTPSSSQATLYLTDDQIGPALDRHQSWSWVIEHRLPLFLRSDLYSEYKLCKLLSSQDDVWTTSTLSPPARSHSSTKLLSSPPAPVKRHCSDTKLSSQVANTSLPLILPTSSSSLILETVSSTSLLSSPKPANVSASISNEELGHKREGSALGTLSKQRSKSTELPGARSLLGPQCTSKMSRGEVKLIGSKSGMKYFWKFLRGKAGEKNWLCWLDAERMSYHSNPLEQQRLLRELRERYLHSSGPLVLPAEIRNKVRVNKTSRLSLSQLKELQDILMEGLKNYWRPRFLVHHSTEVADTTLLSPPKPRPVSCVSFSSQINDGHLENYPRITTPLTPTGTPTFRRLTSGRSRSLSSSTLHTRAQEERESKLFSRTKTDGGRLFAEGSETRLMRIEGPGSSRRVWDKDEVNVKGESPRDKGRKSHFNRAAKYTLHHVPDSSSRCASAMDGGCNNGRMCESQCTILSVSGTPLHTIPPTPTHPHTIVEESSSMELYGPLITCLNTEHRKAGGYFQQYLENTEDKVSLYCLVFWREVQEYKALFVGASFSPCTVEMKAKTLYGRFLTEGGSEGIECAQQVVAIVFANLWPAYEDLFDSAEEHALGVLLLKWVEMVTSEDRLFQKEYVYELKIFFLQLDSVTIKGASGHVRHRVSSALEELEEEELQYSNTFFMRPASSRRLSRASSGYRSSRASSSTSSRQRLSACEGESRAISLNDIIKNRVELDFFKVFLNEHCAAQDLMCWLEIEGFRGIPVCDKTIRNMKAKELKSHYFNKDYLFGTNSPATKEAQRQIMQAGGGTYTGRLPARPRTPVFIEAQKHVRTRLEKKWLAKFVSTPEYISRNKGGMQSALRRNASRINGKDTTNYYENSFANSYEAITLRKMLRDKYQVEMLLRYLNIKAIGTPTANPLLAKQDIEFWLEVQKFKEMCHAHTTNTMLTNKATAIIDCYLQSATPPKIQVDVPIIVADELSGKSGPYMFREAQAAVFKHLYTCWLDYKNYSSGFNLNEIEASLDRLESQILKDANAEKNRVAGEMMEETRRKMTIPRFETLAERQERLRLEEERAEMGDVQVAFRLSNPDHSYTYYTALPEIFVERQTECTPEQASFASKSEEKQRRNAGHSDTNAVLQPTTSSRAEPLPMVATKTNKSKSSKEHIKASVEEEEAMDFEQSVSKQTSRSSASKSKRSTSKSNLRKGAKTPMRYTPKTTISMRRSGEKGGSAFPYGAGLTQELSAITIMSVETL